VNPRKGQLPLRLEESKKTLPLVLTSNLPFTLIEFTEDWFYHLVSLREGYLLEEVLKLVGFEWCGYQSPKTHPPCSFKMVLFEFLCDIHLGVRNLVPYLPCFNCSWIKTTPKNHSIEQSELTDSGLCFPQSGYREMNWSSEWIPLSPHLTMRPLVDQFGCRSIDWIWSGPQTLSTPLSLSLLPFSTASLG